MSYSHQTKSYSTGIGTFANNDIVASFTMPEGQSVRIECAGGAALIVFEHSNDLVTWTAVGTLSSGELVVNVTNNGSIIPLKSNGRLRATGAVTTTSCYVATAR